MRKVQNTFTTGSPIKSEGFPHSDTAGSKVVDTLPAIIAVNRVLLRPKDPRHPLSALIKACKDQLNFLFTMSKS